MFKNIEFGFLRNISIRKRLLFSFLFLAIVPLSLTGYFAYNVSTSSIKGKISSYSKLIVNQVGKDCNNSISKFAGNIQDLCTQKDIQDGIQGFDALDGPNKARFNNRLREISLAKIGFIKGVYGMEFFSNTEQIYTSLNNRAITIAEEEHQRLFALADEKLGSEAWSFAVDSKQKTSLALAKQIIYIQNNKKIGYIIVYVDPEYVDNILNDVDLGKGSNLMILDNNNFVVSDKSKTATIGSKFSLFPISLLDNKDSFTHKLKNESYLMNCYKVENLDWKIVSTIPYSFLNSETKSIQDILLIVIGISFFVSLIWSFITTITISNPLKKLVNLMIASKDGDFRLKIEDHRKDELSFVFKNFREMVSNINKLVSEVTFSSKNVLESSVNVSTLASNSYENSSHISITMEEISKGIVAQANDIADGVNKLNDLSNNINDVNNSLDSVNNSVSMTKSLSKDSLVTLNTLNEKALETKNVTNNIIDNINHLNKDMHTIENILKIISSQASQTQTLSLNAAIEAAKYRGDKAGGFGIVAKEIKKLATKSQSESNLINQIITGIKERVEEIVEITSSASYIVDNQMKAVENTDKSFKAILASMDEVSIKITDSNSLLKDVISLKREVLANIENMSSVAQETAAVAEEVSSRTCEQLNDSKTLSKIANKLEQRAESLGETVSIFKV